VGFVVVGVGGLGWGERGGGGGEGGGGGGVEGVGGGFLCGWRRRHSIAAGGPFERNRGEKNERSGRGKLRTIGWSWGKDPRDLKRGAKKTFQRIAQDIGGKIQGIENTPQ